MPMVSWRIQAPLNKSLTLGLLHISLKGHIKTLCSPNLLGAQMEELNKSTQRSIHYIALRQVGEGAGPSENGNNALKGGQDAARQNRRRHIGILPYTSIPVPAGVRHWIIASYHPNWNCVMLNQGQKSWTNQNPCLMFALNSSSPFVGSFPFIHQCQSCRARTWVSIATLSPETPKTFPWPFKHPWGLKSQPLIIPF